MSPNTRNALGIGFPLLHEFDPKGNVLDKQRERAAAENISLSFLLVEAVKEPPETILAKLRGKLEERKYEVVSFGFGVRGNRDITPLFEKMVNMTLEMQPGVKLAFAVLPSDVFDACMRVLDQ